MRIAICDDEKRICSILAEKVKRFCFNAEIVTYTSGESLLGADELPDIILLDIKMPGKSGMDVAKELRDRDWRKILIFITGEEDRVFDSFDLHAFHFLVKPVADEKLKIVLDNAVRELERQDNSAQSRDKYIEIQSGTSHIRVNLSKLLYAEVYDRKTILHLKDENIEYYGQLSVLEGLVGKDFYRVHRSYLVNMKYVERYDRASVKLQGGDSIPIARREYDGFLKAYLEYSRRRIDS
ncbi:LytTR family DNA-binding domain-containing protein [Ruminobacter sp. RM87]|uniref:LytR/AlgR family response regulator transcription factor n=1 Tax=Ruminobacter sp. RM87 TaxID=1200567 RepID=UPI0004E182D9|nr:LytTR family DNA-binding domain-containing protein [Ruminobacter sp. RM87]